MRKQLFLIKKPAYKLLLIVITITFRGEPMEMYSNTRKSREFEPRSLEVVLQPLA